MPAISTTIRRSSLLAAWRLRVRRYYRTPPRWRGCGSGEITTLDRSGRCPLLVQVVHVSPQLDLAAWLLTRLCSRVQHQPVSDVLELIGIRGIGEPLLVRIAGTLAPFTGVGGPSQRRVAGSIAVDGHGRTTAGEVVAFGGDACGHHIRIGASAVKHARRHAEQEVD